MTAMHDALMVSAPLQQIPAMANVRLHVTVYVHGVHGAVMATVSYHVIGPHAALEEAAVMAHVLVRHLVAMLVTHWHSYTAQTLMAAECVSVASATQMRTDRCVEQQWTVMANAPAVSAALRRNIVMAHVQVCMT